MSLKTPVTRLGSTIGFRIAAGYSLLALASFLALMGVAHLSLAATLARHDMEQVVVELESLREQYREGGMDTFEQAVLINDRSRRNNPFFTRVCDASGRTVRGYFPQYWSEFDLTALEETPPGAAGTWVNLASRVGRHRLEILNGPLGDGRHLQIGISSEDRTLVLRRLRDTFLFAALPLLLLVLAGAGFLAHRLLRPVRHLIQTVQSVHAGEWEAKVPRTGRQDELDELGRLFNELIEKINSLIRGMKDALDEVAHDLRTPLTRFRNRAETALQTEAAPELCRTALQDCVEESDQILRMLNMLMDISAAEAGTLHLRRQPVDLSRLARNVAEMYRYVAEEKGVEVIAAIVPEVRAELDPERVSQVLANLLDNAVKYTPSGGRVELELAGDDGGAVIRVRDTGPGIDPVDLDRIWDRLYRGRQAPAPGIGLGLSLVRAVVATHGGTVTAQNRPEGGAVFTLTLPANGETVRSSLADPARSAAHQA
jgi:signal transduction histidine kinase